MKNGFYAVGEIRKVWLQDQQLSQIASDKEFVFVANSANVNVGVPTDWQM